MAIRVTSKTIARLFPLADLSSLPTTNQGGGKPWSNGGLLSVGPTGTPTLDGLVVSGILKTLTVGVVGGNRLDINQNDSTSQILSGGNDILVQVRSTNLAIRGATPAKGAFLYGTDAFGFGSALWTAPDVLISRYATGPAAQVQAAGGLRVQNLAGTADAQITASLGIFSGNYIQIAGATGAPWQFLTLGSNGSCIANSAGTPIATFAGSGNTSHLTGAALSLGGTDGYHPTHIINLTTAGTFKFRKADGTTDADMTGGNLTLSGGLSVTGGSVDINSDLALKAGGLEYGRLRQRSSFLTLSGSSTGYPVEIWGWQAGVRIGDRTNFFEFRPASSTNMGIYQCTTQVPGVGAKANIDIGDLTAGAANFSGAVVTTSGVGAVYYVGGNATNGFVMRAGTGQAVRFNNYLETDYADLYAKAATFNGGATITGGGVAGSSGLKIGSYNANYGGIWLAADTPATNNYRLLANSLETWVNSPGTIYFGLNNAAYWKISTTAFLPFTTAAVDIGSSANQVRSLYLSGSLLLSNTASGDQINMGSPGGTMRLFANSFGFYGNGGTGNTPVAINGTLNVLAGADASKTLVLRNFSPTHSANAQEWQLSTGTAYASMGPEGRFNAYGMRLHGGSGIGGAYIEMTYTALALDLASNIPLRWSSTTTANTTPDLGMFRNAAGVLEINKGTSIAGGGSYGSLKAANSSFVQGASGEVPITVTGSAWMIRMTRTSLVDIGLGERSGTSFCVYNVGSGLPLMELHAVNKDALFYGSMTWTPAASITPASNGQLTAEATSNTQLTFKLKGTDGIVRSGSLTLS